MKRVPSDTQGRTAITARLGMAGTLTVLTTAHPSLSVAPVARMALHATQMARASAIASLSGPSPRVARRALLVTRDQCATRVLPGTRATPTALTLAPMQLSAATGWVSLSTALAVSVAALARLATPAIVVKCARLDSQGTQLATKTAQARLLAVSLAPRTFGERTQTASATAPNGLVDTVAPSAPSRTTGRSATDAPSATVGTQRASTTALMWI